MTQSGQPKDSQSNDSQEDDAPSPTPGEPELRRWIIDQLATATGAEAAQIDPSATFSSLGVDSVAAVELVADLESRLGRELDPTLVFSAETPAQLAAVLAAGPDRPRRRRRTPTGDPTGGSAHDNSEPIAVVGIGCRFPGSHGPDAYWQMLLDGTDAVSVVPDGRWERDPSLPPSVDLGGFIDGIDQFDPTFFGITQLEADRMDPQQRILLEVAWEALEDAAVPPSTLRGTDVGVFVGISTNEYSRRQSASPELIDVFFGTGNALSIAANRISYALDLHGPSIAIDTACSSSLVAVHLACASLRRGECTSALAGGANAILTPLLTLNFTGAGVIAPDGRCKTFDASADGIVRGEGVGLVHLKRLSEAVADGDRIYCVIDGSATNQDGRSNGLTAPNPEAQIEVFTAACEAAGVDPREVDYVEAHGTGTVLGDAMELRSLDTVYGVDRPEQRPLLVGSVKTNIGHLESAAGIAGLIKAALSLRHGVLAPTLHYREPNPYLSETNNIRVVAEPTPWDEAGTRRTAVSGFGFGGTNAHVLMSAAPGPGTEGPVTVARARTDDGAHLPIVLPLSARSTAALDASVTQHATLLGQAPELARELATAQALTREQHPRRLAVVATDGDTVTKALDEVAAGRRHPAVVAGDRRSSEPARVAFLFSGQGRPWWPLDAELLTDPVISSVLRTCDAELRELSDFSLLDVIRSGEAVVNAERAQPILFALQIALAARWRAFGVEPDLILGQSIGEIAAAHVAGAIPLGDAIELVVHRGRLMEESNGTGHTGFIELPASEVTTMVADLGLDVTIAAVTAPDNCVVSGPKPDMVAIIAAATERGVMALIFEGGDIPGHGPLMTPYAEKLTAAVDFLDPRPTSVPMISSVTAAPILGEELGAAYWGRNLRQQVRLLEAIEVAAQQGTELFIEVAPHPLAVVSTRRTLEAAGSNARVLHTVKQGEPGAIALRRSLASAWVAGATVDWRAVTGRTRATARALPSPWDHRRCWFDAVAPTRSPAIAARGPRWHPLLEQGVHHGDGTTTWRAIDSGSTRGDTPTPGVATVLELAIAATRSIAGTPGVALSDVRLASGLERTLGARGRVEGLSVTVSKSTGGLRWWVDMTATTDGDGVLTLAKGGASPLDGPPPELLGPDRFAVDAPALDGIAMPAQVSSAKADDDTAVLVVDVPAPTDGGADWAVAPLLLDAAVAGILRLGPIDTTLGGHVELSGFDELTVLGAPVAAARIVVERSTDDAIVVDEWGAPVLELRRPKTGRGLPVAPADEMVVPVWTDLPSAVDGDDGGSATRSMIVVAATPGPIEDHLAGIPGAIRADMGDIDERLAADRAGEVVVVGIESEALRDLLVNPGLAGRTVRVISDDHTGLPLMPALIREHPEVDLCGVDLDGDPASTDTLVGLLRRDDTPQLVRIRRGTAQRGRLDVVPVPDVVRSDAPAGQREHTAVWGDDGLIHVVQTTAARSWTSEPSSGRTTPGRTTSATPARIVIDRVLLAGASRELAVAGEPAGVAAVGRVVDGPTDIRGRTVATVLRGAATTRVDVEASRAWPVPDNASGMRALLALQELIPDLPVAAELDPGVVAATFGALLEADSERDVALRTLADLAGTRPDGPLVAVVGDPATPVEEMSDRWAADGRWAVLAADDDSLADAVVDWLRDRGASVSPLDESTDAPDGVIAVGAAPGHLLVDLDVPMVWIGPSALLLGTSRPDPDELLAATAMDTRRQHGLPTTTFLVGPGIAAATALAVLDRVLLAEVESAVYDPDGRDELAATSAASTEWFAELAISEEQVEIHPADASLAAALATAAPSERRSIVARHLTEEIAAIIGIDGSAIDGSEPVDTYGVDSLVGMEMRSRIQDVFGYEVPLSELSRSMTIDDLTAHLVDNAIPALLAPQVRTMPGRGPGGEPADGDGSRAVAVQRGGGPASWWIPGIFGSAEVFGPLGTLLAEQDLWAVESDGDAVSSIPALAEAHLRAIRAQQPSGPYRIGGYSFGALVAVEIALALEAAGETVQRLWLLDPPPPFAPDDDQTRTHRVERVRQLLGDHLVELFGIDPPGDGDLPALVADADLTPLVDRIVTSGTRWTPERVRRHLGDLWTTTATSLTAMATHRPSGILTTPTELVVAGRSDLFGSVPGADWSDFLAHPVGPTTVDTDHAGLMQPAHAPAVAELVRRSLGTSTPLGDQRFEDQMRTDAAPITMKQRVRSEVISRLTTSPRSRSAVGAIGNAYRTGDFFLRALAAERRFRRMCTIGDGFIAGDNAQITNLSGDPSRIRFGDNCLIDGYINLQEYGYFTMGSYSAIGEKVRIDCSGYVEIGNGCTMAEGVYIVDGLHHPILVDERIHHGIDLFQGSHVMDAYGSGTETSFVRIEDLVWIGLRAIVLSGVTIGRGSVISAGAVVSQDVPPFSVVAGNPGRVIGRIPAGDTDIESHPTYREVHGEERLPDHRRPVREVLDEIAARVAARRS